MLMLMGRWDFSRLAGSFEVETALIGQPRTWVVVLIVVLTLAVAGRRWAGRLTAVDWGVAAFFAYMAATALWAPDEELARIKLGEALLGGVAYFSVSIACAAMGAHELQEGFWKTLVAVGVVLALAAFVARGHNGRFCTPGGGPIPFGRNMGLMALGMLHLTATRPPHWKIYSAMVAALGGLAIIASGSRGALLSAMVAGTALLLLSRVQVSRKMLYVGGLVLCVGAAVFGTSAGSTALDVFQERVLETTIQRGHLADRDTLWTLAIDLTKEKPVFGWGLNGFWANSWIYPHNLFLEVSSEGGLVGLALLLVPILGWFFAWRMNRQRITAGSVAAVVLVLMSAQTSGDLYDSRGVFMLVILSTHLAFPTAREKRQHAVVRQPARQRPPVWPPVGVPAATAQRRPAPIRVGAPRATGV